MRKLITFTVITAMAAGLPAWARSMDDHRLPGGGLFNLAAPAPPPPVPAPSPPLQPAPPSRPTPASPVGPFIVFFDRNRSDINPVTAAILDNVAAAYRSSDSMQLMLAGNADTSGTAEHNMILAQRRVKNVKGYLAGRGLPEAGMSITVYGETRPLVETGDGVPEPQNRNVQIFFGPGPGQ